MYIPIDVSRSMLEQTARRLVQEYPRLRVLGLVGQYEAAVSMLPPSNSRLVVFLGGTIGNFTPAFQSSFFTHLSHFMRPQNHLLLGFDRRAHRGKPARVIHDAYNDAQGVTARFNLNLLRRLNRELGADFDLRPSRTRRCTTRQKANRDAPAQPARADGALSPRQRATDSGRGETILTELSRKFDPDELAAWFARHGFRLVRNWTDPAEYFGLMLLRRDTN